MEELIELFFFSLERSRMCEKMQFPKQSILAGFEGRLAGVRSIEGPKTRKRAGGAGPPWILNLTMTRDSPVRGSVVTSEGST